MQTYIELVQGLGVQGADEKLGALINILLGLLKKNGIEIASGVSLTLVSVTTARAASKVEPVSGGNVASESTLGGSVDESLTDEDLGSNDDGSSGQELSVDNGHGANEAESDDNGLHFAVS